MNFSYRPDILTAMYSLVEPRLRLRPHALLPLGLLFLAGCGGGGSTGGHGQSQTVLAPAVRTLPSDGSVTVSAVTDTSVTLTGKVPSLKPGDILMSQKGQGLLRSVTAVSQAAGVTTVTTAPAVVTDAVEQCDASFSKAFSSTDVTSFTPGIDGTTLTPAFKGGGT